MKLLIEISEDVLKKLEDGARSNCRSLEKHIATRIHFPVLSIAPPYVKEPKVKEGVCDAKGT